MGDWMRAVAITFGLIMLASAHSLPGGSLGTPRPWILALGASLVAHNVAVKRG